MLSFHLFRLPRGGLLTLTLTEWKRGTVRRPEHKTTDCTRYFSVLSLLTCAGRLSRTSFSACPALPHCFTPPPLDTASSAMAAMKGGAPLTAPIPEETQRLLGGALHGFTRYEGAGPMGGKKLGPRNKLADPDSDLQYHNLPQRHPGKDYELPRCTTSSPRRPRGRRSTVSNPRGETSQREQDYYLTNLGAGQHRTM